MSMTPIGLDINIPELTQHALEYFPSLDDDRGTTRNYAQGLLTNIFLRHENYANTSPMTRR